MLKSNFKIIVNDMDHFLSIMLILNSYGIIEGLASKKRFERPTPFILYIEGINVSHSGTNFSGRNDSIYGKEYLSEEFIKTF